MTDKSNVTTFDGASAKGPRLAVLNSHPPAAAENSWIVEGRLNKRFIERQMQEMIGVHNRKDYKALAEQLDVLMSGLDKALAAGTSEDDLKRSIGQFTIAANAVASSAMPAAFNCWSD